jgi:hypothetical protein
MCATGGTARTSGLDEALEQAHPRARPPRPARPGLAAGCPHDKRDLASPTSRRPNLLGFCRHHRPAAQEAIEAVAACQAAGIRVKMITGDHAVTAGRSPGKLGLGSAAAPHRREMDDLDDARSRAGPEVDVFARASPEHKLRLVRPAGATARWSP